MEAWIFGRKWKLVLDSSMVQSCFGAFQPKECACICWGNRDQSNNEGVMGPSFFKDSSAICMPCGVAPQHALSCHWTRDAMDKHPRFLLFCLPADWNRSSWCSDCLRQQCLVSGVTCCHFKMTCHESHQSHRSWHLWAFRPVLVTTCVMISSCCQCCVELWNQRLFSSCKRQTKELEFSTKLKQMNSAELDWLQPNGIKLNSTQLNSKSRTFERVWHAICSTFLNSFQLHSTKIQGGKFNSIEPFQLTSIFNCFQPLGHKVMNPTTSRPRHTDTHDAIRTIYYEAI